MTCQDIQPLIHAYLDGELDLVRSLEMEKHLQSCHACMQVLANCRTLQGALRSDALYFKAPSFLESNIRMSLWKTQPRRLRLGNWAKLVTFAASIAVLLAVGLMVARDRLSAKDFLVREIVASHVRSLMATHLTDVASSDQHTVKPWFRGQLDFSPPIKDLSKEDFTLVGGRLDYVGDHSVAALVYQRRKHFINLFIWPSDSAASPAALSQQGYQLIHWSDGGLTYWAVSDLNEKELEEFVQLVRN
jgi:anti-sigma factor RsiW